MNGSTRERCSAISDGDSNLTNVRLLEDAFIRPRFLEELYVAQDQEAILVDGADELTVYRDPLVANLFPVLRNVMDGSRTPEQIAAALPNTAVTDVRAVIARLSDWGLIEEGNEGAVDPRANPETLAFLCRHLGATGANLSSRTAYNKLAQTGLFVCAASPISSDIEFLSGLLMKTGFGEVVQLCREEIDDRWKHIFQPAKGRVIISLCLGEDEEWHKRLDQWCQQHGTLWLRVAIDKERGCADIGPLFDGEKLPCYRCFRDVHIGDIRSTESQTLPYSPSHLMYIMSLLAIELTFWFTGVGHSINDKGFQRYNLNDLTFKSFRCTRTPGCPRCRPVSQAISSDTPMRTDTAIVFEDYIGLQSRPHLSRRAEQQYSDLSAQLSRQSKQFLNSRRQKLDYTFPSTVRSALAALSSGIAETQQTLRVEQLSTILLMTCGIRQIENYENKIQRWAATSGNLGSVELFVIVRHVEGIQPGLYFYQSQGHSLARFERRGGAVAFEELIRRVMPFRAHALPDALCIFTGAYHRTARKYGQFAYKLINLDAGVAISQFHAVSRSLGLRSKTLVRWPDNLLEDQLNLRPLEEQITAVAALWGSPCKIAFPEEDYLSSIKGNSLPPPSQKYPHEFLGLSIQNILEEVYKESRIKEEELQLSPTTNPSTLLRKVEVDSLSGVQLPPPTKNDVTIEAVLSQRKSIRSYSDLSVTLEQLSTLLEIAHHADVSDWPEENGHALGLGFLIIAWKVEGLDPGVYRYHPASHSISLERNAPSLDDGRELFVQEEFASAPLLIWITGDLAAACARHGAFGHRQLLLRAGSAANRLWLAALAIGLEGAVTAGVIPGVARHQLGLDGYRRASLVAFVAGSSGAHLAGQDA